MPGREHTILPNVGREHVLEVDGESWVIKPRFSATFAVDQVAAELGTVPEVPLTPAQQAALGEAVVEQFLTDAQREQFEAWGPERQTWCAGWLLGVWNEIRSGETGLEHVGPDPTSTSSASDADSDATSETS